ncbi:polysaccharide pyruvyl transferase family protein [Georhizobium profundi]|uniref:Polysaccharide pyruvyl transferase family protein n=1 Tax=Georhizobium profundi TaxID=2341112 RepID=A0A3Q8XQ05_9HYPH|nr:polysaccharide pyruvyl transferase family protein [Georhizobium profundi]AZN72618.1 polysaccharide pyruvyl transferase family protein [Georhizobium profundi]
MTPFYWESDHGNFGDDLNLWLWDFLLPGFRDVAPDVLLVGVGTVLNADLLQSGGRKLVIGSGFGYGALPDMSDTSLWDIRCVRGPLTAEKVGLPEALGIIDPAVMVADMPEFQSIKRNGGTIFVPHWESTIGSLWPELCRLAGMGYVDPCGEAKSVIRAIASAELVVAESMHAAILADAFRVPWVAVTTSNSINSFKWTDWARSVGVEYAPRRLPISSRAEAIAKGASFWGVDFANRKMTATAPSPDGTTVLERHAPADQAGSSGLRQLTKQILSGPATLALWRAARAPARLSDEARLNERKARFSAVLDDIRRDYF